MATQQGGRAQRLELVLNEVETGDLMCVYHNFLNFTIRAGCGSGVARGGARA